MDEHAKWCSRWNHEVGNYKFPKGIKKSSHKSYRLLEDAYNFGLLDDLLKTLTSREEFILRLRFATCGGEPMTYQQIGDIIGGITGGRVGSIIMKALRRISHPKIVEMIYTSGFPHSGVPINKDTAPIFKCYIDDLIAGLKHIKYFNPKRFKPITAVTDIPRLFKLEIDRQLKL